MDIRRFRKARTEGDPDKEEYWYALGTNLPDGSFSEVIRVPTLLLALVLQNYASGGTGGIPESRALLDYLQKFM